MSILHWLLLTALLSFHHSDYVIGSSTRNSSRITSVYCPNPIGVADRDIIPDSSFTATSSSVHGYQAHQARLHGGPRGWAPRAYANPNDYLQIDLGEEFIVCAVATQGCRIHEEKVTEYKISTSTNGKSWNTYKNDGKDKLFPGNLLNSNDVKTNFLDPSVDARFIRFIPTKCISHKVLRVEVYGSKKYPHPNPIGVSNSSIIPNHRFTATSHYNSSYTPYHARLYDDYGWAPKTTSNPNDYLQIDLGAVFVINALSTQGSSMTNEWTTEYKISTSIENKTWSMYRETGGKVKMFPVDLLRSNDVKTNVLDPPVDARFIRFIPTNYSGYKVLRVEVYGILKVTLQGIRLSGGSTLNQGYLEVRIKGQWGKICARSWTLREAKIACNMLGMTGKASPWSPPLISELPTIMNLKRCNGDETALQDCTFVESGLKNCSPFLVRGVTCGPPSVYIAIVKKADKLYLERSVYIHSVTLNRSCQAKNTIQYHILPVINVYDTKSGRSILCNVTMDTGHEQKAKCGVDFKTNAVRIRSSDKNATLKLCDEPDVSAFDDATNIRGVLYDLWKKHTKLDDSSILKLHEVFSGPADISSISPSFIITGLSGLSNYSLREQGYVMVSTPGLYFISASCGDECEVWLRRAEEPGLNDKGTDDELLIKIESPTNPNLYKLSRSQYKFENFSKCHLYHMEAYMRQRVNQDYLTVVVKLPVEQKIQLFPHEFLYWMRPGSRVLKFRSTNKISTKIALGSEITFEAVYEFCCKGLLCPSCPLVLQLLAFDQSIVVNRSLEMNCQEYKMTYTFVVVVQPGNYSIDIIYHFLDDITHWQGKRTIVKSIQVSDSTRLQCYFNRECPGWIISSNTSSTSCKWSLDGSGSIALTSPGVSSLESPSMPWNSDYKHISLCVEFSYLLPTNTSSRLEVFRKTTSSKELLWLLSGYHGTVWQRAYIPVMSEEDFQITFSGDSKVNGSIAMAIRDFQVTSRSCKLRPVFAKPESQCKVTEFKCQNGQCVNKNQRCNGIHGDCLDDSDEDKCVCQTDQFSCFNDKCIKYKSLCNGIRDCPKGEDEANCDQKCSLQQCLDGTYGSCGQLTSCNATNYQPCDVDAVKYTPLNATRCQIHRGVCGFDNELCGLQIDTKSPLVWDFFKPVDFQSNKHDFPNYDHTSMTDQESYMLLKSNENTKTGFGRLLKDWNTVRIFCMQFWYFIPDNSDSSLEIVIDTATSTKLLWKTSNSTSGDWAYGQVQIPGNLPGKIIITGYVSTSFVAIDDFGLVEGGCASVYSQRIPSCYFEKNDACTWDLENPWTQSKLPVVYEPHSLIKGPVYPYLVLSKSEKKRSTISSPFIHPAEGWRCLRFWFYSGKKYFERKLTVEYQTDKKTTEEWSYESETDKWTFIQLPIPEIQEPLQVKINGQKYLNNAILAIKDLTFSKEHCLKIPAHQECHQYKTLSFSDRRKDTISEYEMFKGCDDHLSRKAWYRVVDSAGNELARSCVKRSSSCSTDYMGWINGSLPSVGDGIVERQLCFASESKCCSKKTIVKIRNCKKYAVYQFPKKVPTCPSKYCSVYRHECEDQPIGVANSSIVPDDRFTATSQYSHRYKPYYARLNSVARGWEPKTNDNPNDYLQIDLGTVFAICAIATQGHSMINEWTTEYKIETSTDNKTWAMYRQNGGEVKLFSGNRDGHTVVKNALNDTRTHARFIRFIPTKYYSFKVFRVEVYGYIKENLKSNIQKEWKGWIKGLYEKVKWEVLDESSYEKIVNSIEASGGSQKTETGFSIGSKNHSIDIKINETLDEMTLCLWLSTSNLSTIKVEVDYVEEEKNKVNAITYLEIYNVTSKNIENWRHICVTWMSNFGVWQTYLDGAARDHGTGVLDREELNRGNRISIHFDSQVQKTEVKFTRLNVWSKVLSEQYILYMSYKCGAETGNYLRWNDYLNALPEGSSVLKIYRSTCKGKQGNVLSLISPSYIKTPTLATITSPRYERSSYSPDRCLKFRYKMWGAGARALRIYQELDNKEYSKRPIWTIKDSGDSRWRDGQVTLTAVMGYKLVIQGEVTSTPGLLSIGALYTTEGNCVDIIPRSAMEACNEILSNKTGKIYSPYYPGYYDNNANCTWTIKASKGHVIQLEFKVFELELSPRCSADFVEVYDGEIAPTISRIGRYCGTSYPHIIQSQSSTIKVVFTTNNDIMRTGFKAYYQIIKDAQDGDDCVQDCPFDCNCQRQKDGGIVVSSAQLLSVPNPLPMKTKAILFSGSQIHKVESNTHFKLSYLSLIDLSCNRVFLVEEMSFVDLPSLKTLRLRRNFLREVQKNMFSHLPQLEVVDLGENLISTVGWDAFSGFPALRALSLRSNRIKTLHQLTFQNNTNLTYLYLQDNLLKTIPPGIFKKQKYLEVLFLHKNRIEQFDKSSFEGLKRLRKLTLKNNPINEQAVSREAFENLRQLEYLSIDSFILCCYAKESIPNLNCVSPGNEFSSCNDMLKSFYVRVCIWVEGICAALGNLAVIAWWAFLALIKRKTSTAFNSVQSLLLCHLAFADFLMGVYLLFIATYDELWKGEYFKHDVEWRAGVKCKIAGVISTLSSEVSVMILVAITADRMNTILFQFSGRRTNLKVAHALCLCIWVTGFIMSFTPLFVPTYFNDEVSGFSFYGRSTVCLPLQLSTDRPAGWEYSVAVFIGFNGVAFLFILLGYLAIFIKVRQSARKVRSSSKTDTSLAKRVFFVILTDFCCWMPVVVIGLLSLNSGFNDPSVYIWIAVFVLPINSSINPIVYTFSSPQTIKNLKLLRDWWLKKEGRNPVKGQHSSSGATGSSALKTKEEIAGDHHYNKMAATGKILRPSEDYSIENECEDTKL